MYEVQSLCGDFKLCCDYPMKVEGNVAVVDRNSLSDVEFSLVISNKHLKFDSNRKSHLEIKYISGKIELNEIYDDNKINKEGEIKIKSQTDSFTNFVIKSTGINTSPTPRIFIVKFPVLLNTIDEKEEFVVINIRKHYDKFINGEADSFTAPIYLEKPL